MKEVVELNSERAERLVERYTDMLLRIGYTWLGDMDDANDGAGYDVGMVVMKDGTEWVLHAGGDHMDENGQGWLKMELRDAQDNQVLIDPTQVKTMYLGESEISLS